MIPVLKLVCNNCGREFDVNPSHYAELGLRSLPRRCPTCCDVQQARPSVVVDRRLLAVYDNVEIVSLPCEWEQVQTKKGDFQGYKISISGSHYGAAWSGRITIFSPWPAKAGDVVSIREMETAHRVKYVAIEKSTRHGVIESREYVPVTNSTGKETVLTRRYLALDHCQGEAKTKLVWAVAHTKTTLKGLGRQYYSNITGTPVAYWRIEGGVRSGRKYSVGVLAVVDSEHPLVVKTTGDIEEEVVFGGVRLDEAFGNYC